jgi:hypothetical protein
MAIEDHRNKPECLLLGKQLFKSLLIGVKLNYDSKN